VLKRRSGGAANRVFDGADADFDESAWVARVEEPPNAAMLRYCRPVRVFLEPNLARIYTARSPRYLIVSNSPAPPLLSPEPKSPALLLD
jgi:hypothetical protein